MDLLGQVHVHCMDKLSGELFRARVIIFGMQHSYDWVDDLITF